MQQIEKEFILKPDEVYGFDLAVYPKNEDGKHLHSLALIKMISEQ